jgi:hypothetical protein
MRVLLDAKPCETNAASVGAAIAGAAAIAEEHGRVLVEVVVDGTIWGDEQFGSVEACAGTAEEICLTSADLQELVRQTLSDGSSALLDADRLQREAARLLHEDDLPQAMTRLGEALAIWQSLYEAVLKSAGALELDLALIKVGDGTAQESVERLAATLHTLRETVRANDPVGIADTLLYDLPDVVGEWRAVVQSLLDEVDHATNPLVSDEPE